MANLVAIRREIAAQFERLGATLASGGVGAGVGPALPTDSTGTTFFVDSVNGDNSRSGARPTSAFATLVYALTQMVAGDTVVLLELHAETIATTNVTLSLAGIRVIGQGIGSRMASITGNVADDTFDVTGVGIVIENIRFNEATSVTGGAINVGAADCIIRGCQFDQGTNDFEAITLEAAGDNCIIENNKFNVTADGPNAGIEIEAAGVDSLLIRNNIFVCSDGTDAYDVAAINSVVANTNMIVMGNIFTGVGVNAKSVVAASAVGMTLRNNFYAAGAESMDVEFNPILGYKVTKSSATLPASATQDIFVIAGGRVLVTMLTGEVTTVIESQACNLSVILVTTVETDFTLASVFDINADLLGDLYHVEADGSALVRTQSGVVPGAAIAKPAILAEGTINITTAATNTGATSWELWYFPLDEGASVVSA